MIAKINEIAKINGQNRNTTQRSTVISLLKEGYSLRQIESKTGLGRSTIGRIKKVTDSGK